MFIGDCLVGKHGTCPTCRHPFLPHLQPVDSDDEEESDGGEYIPPDYDADTDFETDYEDFLDSDGGDSEAVDTDGEGDGEGDGAGAGAGEVPDATAAQDADEDGDIPLLRPRPTDGARADRAVCEVYKHDHHCNGVS